MIRIHIQNSCTRDFRIFLINLQVCGNRYYRENPKQDFVHSAYFFYFSPSTSTHILSIPGEGDQVQSQTIGRIQC